MNARSSSSDPEPRWTPLRSEIFAALESSPMPLGAYDLIDKLAATGTRHAPMTIYRTLDFLMANHLVHKVESANTFFVCRGHHAAETAMVLMICETCGHVLENQSAQLQTTLTQEARKLGFIPRAQVLELRGMCESCGKL